MPEKNMDQELRLTKKDEITHYSIEKINRNELMSKKHKIVCRVLNYIDHLLIAVSTITGCISISAFASLIAILVGITSSATGLKICVISPGIKKYKSIIKKKRKKHDKIVLFAKPRLNRKEVLLSKALTDLNISQNEFVIIDNALMEFYDMKEEIKNYNNK